MFRKLHLTWRLHTGLAQQGVSQETAIGWKPASLLDLRAMIVARLAISRVNILGASPSL